MPSLNITWTNPHSLSRDKNLKTKQNKKKEGKLNVRPGGMTESFHKVANVNTSQVKGNEFTSGKKSE